MESDLEGLLTTLLKQGEEFRSARLGLYLHGSESRGEARADSDIDVLGLCEDAEAADVSDRFKIKVAAIEHPLASRLDFKVIAAHLFAEDPWVDLARARWLGGHAWHQELPAPTFDQRARESLLVLAVLFEDHDFAQSETAKVRKPVGRLCSVLAQLTGDEVPISGNDARRMLRDRTGDPRVRELVQVADDLDRVSGQIDSSLSDRIQNSADEVAAAVAECLAADGFGPHCTPAADHAVKMWQAARSSRGSS